MLTLRNLKKLFSNLRLLPLHPQWLVFRTANASHRAIGAQVKGLVLDIGCANQYMKAFLSSKENYIGLDYYQTATAWYETKPDVYGDAQNLPFVNQSLDSVLLLDVLEHLPNPEAALAEIARVLKPQGIFVVQVPFLYPLHDQPLDFQRWTEYGLTHLARKHGFTVKDKQVYGHPLETAALLSNIALSKTWLNWLADKNPLLILGIFLPFVILLNNISAYVLALLSREEKMMPHGYRITLVKHPTHIIS